MWAKKKSWFSPRAYIRLDITQPELHNSLRRQQSIQDPLGRQRSIQNPFLSVHRSFPEPSNAPTRRSSGACYSCATYNWIARFPRFTDQTTLSDHLHVLNAVTFLYQCGQIWMVTDISVWLSYNQATRSGRLQGDHNVWISCVDLKYPHPRGQLGGINTFPSLSRKELVQTSCDSRLIIEKPRIGNRSITLLNSLYSQKLLWILSL